MFILTYIHPHVYLHTYALSYSGIHPFAYLRRFFPSNVPLQMHPSHAFSSDLLPLMPSLSHVIPSDAFPSTRIPSYKYFWCSSDALWCTIDALLPLLLFPSDAFLLTIIHLHFHCHLMPFSCLRMPREHPFRCYSLWCLPLDTYLMMPFPLMPSLQMPSLQMLFPLIFPFRFPSDALLLTIVIRIIILLPKPINQR